MTSLNKQNVELLSVIKKNGKTVNYDPSKIESAALKAIYSVSSKRNDISLRSKESISKIYTVSDIVTEKLIKDSLGVAHAVSIETVHDAVELALMEVGLHLVAKEYILYRDSRSKELDNINVVTPDGVVKFKEIIKTRYFPLLNEYASDLLCADIDKILTKLKNDCFNNIKIKDLDDCLIITIRNYMELDPEYDTLVSRIYCNFIREEVIDNLSGVYDVSLSIDKETSSKTLFECYLEHGQYCGAIMLSHNDKSLSSIFDLRVLSDTIDHSLDNSFKFLGIKTLYDRYLLHKEHVRYELPQFLFMRISMGLSLNEDNPTMRAIEFYKTLSANDYMTSTPTMFNALLVRAQLSSCYLSTIPDDLAGIYDGIKDNALLSKFAGGLGNDWTPVRALGSHIKGTNGESQGTVPFLKVANDSAIAVNQGGKRKGAVCAYLESWHLDIEEFLELRKNTGDDRRRTHDMNTANWVPDLFMERVLSGGEWTLFSPNDVPELHDLYGPAFKEKYMDYELQAKAGFIPLYKTVRATDLWRKMLGMLFETGHPWITFKDPCNMRSPQQHVGVVHSSNLCTEITLNTSNKEGSSEIAVCNLGSINLKNHLNKDGSINLVKLKCTVTVAVRMLDNVIDVNFYPVESARRSNMRHRPVGLGIMGFADVLFINKIPYCSDAAVDMAEQFQKYISMYAIKASALLAAERGAYETYEGSLWSKGILPLDSAIIFNKYRGNNSKLIINDDPYSDEWTSVRNLVLKNGMRNSNIMAIAPTATIANIVGVGQSIEPTYMNLYVKSNLSGEFTSINPYLVNDLKELGIWDSAMIDDLKHYEGELENIDRIPDYLKTIYLTAFSIPPEWIIEAASRRQIYIDQAQSLNLYIRVASGRDLDNMYRLAWLKCCKTTYYLRALAATQSEKSTTNRTTLNAVSALPKSESSIPAPVPLACSIDNPDCEACQ